MAPPTESTQRRALEELYVTHERGLFNAAYRYVWSAEEARDIVHDAFVRLWDKRARIDWDRAAGLAYTVVLGIARNRRRAAAVRRAFGHAAPRGPVDAGDAPARPDDALAAARRDDAVRACIDELPERLRSVLVLCTFAELDHAQIAAAMGIAAGTVGSRRNEAIARIRARLERLGHA